MKGKGKGQRGRGSGERGRGRAKEAGEGVREAEVGVLHLFQEEMTEDEIRKNLEHNYMEELLLQEEQKLQAYETKQDEFDQVALRLTLEEEAMYKRMDEERLKELLGIQKS
uniref:Chloramphenicol acetyltransferase-like domain-containing protein n=1 Tax=Tanacetum cinerariifolium TaxID=118510 RepID=A0A699U4N9_TANCI|nr:chloramphenicol acetyltransferase-like domain-containing protein [Tanacetum cinerariifolium]